MLRVCLAPGKLTLLCVWLASSQQPDFCRCGCVCVFSVSFSCVLAGEIPKNGRSTERGGIDFICSCFHLFVLSKCAVVNKQPDLESVVNI